MKEIFTSSKTLLIIKIVVTVLLAYACPYIAVFLFVVMSFNGYWTSSVLMSVLVVPFAIPIIWIKKKKIYVIAYIVYIILLVALLATQIGMNIYNEKTTIDVTPNINVDEYLPFDSDSKIVQIKSNLLSFDDVEKDQLPIIDGAAAAFPVYSAFVNAVYPNTVNLDDGVFVFNNTQEGYESLARKKTDIFIGAAPSEQQINFAKKKNTAFDYTKIGYEAFVFFVHKDNPVNSLTVEQIKGIYSGEITNWSEVGGVNEKIAPFQRNEGSGSQSMFVRFMRDTPIIEPDMQTEVGTMGGIIEEVADYKNKSSSIGFSFRYYVEGIIQNPDIKLIAIDGIAPTKENIRSGKYPIVAPVFAVTYEGNKKENVHKLIEWMLSDEAQNIIEETGYVGIG